MLLSRCSCTIEVLRRNHSNNLEYANVIQPLTFTSIPRSYSLYQSFETVIRRSVKGEHDIHVLWYSKKLVWPIII